MEPSTYSVVLSLKNDALRDLHLYLEMVSQEVILSPGHAIDLLAKPSPLLLPLTVEYIDGGLLVFPRFLYDPDWHVCFRGKVFRTSDLTRLADYE